MTKALMRMNAIRVALGCVRATNLASRGAESLDPLWQIGRAQALILR